MTEQIG